MKLEEEEGKMGVEEDREGGRYKGSRRYSGRI